MLMGAMSAVNKLIRGGLDLQRAYNFDIIMPSMFGIDGYAVGKFCQNIRFGQYDIAELSRMRLGAFKTSFAGLLDISSITATFLKPVPDIVSAYFNEWRLKIVDGSGFFGIKSDYARSIYIILSATNGLPSGVYRLTGVFPQKMPVHALDYGTEDVVRLDVELNVDRVIETESSTGLGAALGEVLLPNL